MCIRISFTGMRNSETLWCLLSSAENLQITAEKNHISHNKAQALSRGPAFGLQSQDQTSLSTCTANNVKGCSAAASMCIYKQLLKSHQASPGSTADSSSANFGSFSWHRKNHNKTFNLKPIFLVTWKPVTEADIPIP